MERIMETDMKKILALMGIAVLLLCIASGCAAAPAFFGGAEPAATATATAKVTPIPTVRPTEEPTPEPTATPEPVVRSYTTGRRAVGNEIPNYRPTIVSIENSKAARPQVALNQADIIYEMAVEYAITRFQLLFNDEYPIYTGPVRSSRVYLMYLQMEWHCMYVHHGYGGPAFNGDIAIHADRALKRAKPMYWRSNEKGKKTEHTLMVNVLDLVNRLYNDYRPTPTDTRFQFDEGVDYAEGKPFDSVTLNFFYRDSAEEDKITFRYNEDTNTLQRYQDGTLFRTRTPIAKKKYTTEDFYCQNLIVQYAQYSELYDSKRRRDCQLIGSGECDYFINGKHVTGTWERPSAESNTSYYLDDGSLLTMEPGRTWIAIHPIRSIESPVNITYR